MFKGCKVFHLLMVVMLVLASLSVRADDEVSYLLKESVAPAGVVFEVLTHEQSTWPTVLAYINTSAERLRKKFPDLPVAIVSHGLEEFALLKQNAAAQQSTHSEIKSLLKKNVKVEVCGTFAQWNGYSDQDFPDYITVVGQAPRSIESFEESGYSVIVIDREYLDAQLK